MLNRVILIGNLGKDPEIKKLENGSTVGKFSVATNEYYRDNNNELQQQTEWHDVVVWRQLAEQAEKILRKGALVYIEGKIAHRKYTDKNGVERTLTEIAASTFKLLDKKEANGISPRETNFPTSEPPHIARASSAAETHPPYNNSNTPDDDLPF